MFRCRSASTAYRLMFNLIWIFLSQIENTVNLINIALVSCDFVVHKLNSTKLNSNCVWFHNPTLFSIVPCNRSKKIKANPIRVHLNWNHPIEPMKHFHFFTSSAKWEFTENVQVVRSIEFYAWIARVANENIEKKHRHRYIHACTKGITENMPIILDGWMRMWVKVNLYSSEWNIVKDMNQTKNVLAVAFGR